MAFRNKIEEELFSKGLWKSLSDVLSQGVGKSYADIAAFNADGGASNYGTGSVWIGGVQYWCDGTNVLFDDITFEQFGAVGDGVTDDTEAVRKCLNEAQTLGARIKGRQNSKYLITSNIEIDRQGKKILDLDMNFSTFKFMPEGRITLTLNPHFLTTTLTTELNRGDLFIPLASVSGILPGDIIFINSPAISNSSPAAQRLYTLHYYVVSEVIGNNVYIEGSLVSDIKLSQLSASGIGSPTLSMITVQVRRPTPDVYIRNGYCEVDDPLSATITSRYAKIDLNGCRMSYLENIHFTGRCRTQVYQRNSAYTFIDRCTFDYAGYISEDNSYVPPLISGSPNGYGYGVLSERSWFSKITNSGGNLSWHVFDVTEGQMHIYYENCWGSKCRPAFSTHSNAWHVNIIGCKVFSGGGVSGFRCHYPTVIDCDFQDLTLEAFNYASCCIEINLLNNSFVSNYSGSFAQLIRASSGGNPYTTAPGAISQNYPVSYRLQGNTLESKGLKFFFNFGVDNINQTSECWITDNTFINLNSWSSTNSYLHPKSYIYNNNLRGALEQFFITIPATTYPTNSRIWFFDNKLQADSITQVNNAMLYVITSNSNVDYRFKGNIVNDFAALVRLGSGGTFNVSQIEQNNVTGKLFTTTGAETINVSFSIGNVYNTIASSMTGINIAKSSQNVDRSLL